MLEVAPSFPGLCHHDTTDNMEKSVTIRVCFAKTFRTNLFHCLDKTLCFFNPRRLFVAVVVMETN